MTTYELASLDPNTILGQFLCPHWTTPWQAKPKGLKVNKAKETWAHRGEYQTEREESVAGWQH